MTGSGRSDHGGGTESASGPGSSRTARRASRGEPVGWYVHHHGAGHLTRFLAIRPHLDHDVVVFSSLPAPPQLPDRTTWIDLPRDDDPIPTADGRTRSPLESDPTAAGALHWVPIGQPGHARRLSMIAAEHVARAFAAFVVDVSVEVTLFTRLLGIPPIVVTQPGNRSDSAHTLAYDVAARILAPWPGGRHESATLSAYGDRVAHVGGISRFDGRDRELLPIPQTVLVLGSAGDTEIAHRVAAARTTTPDTTWSLIGAGGGWVDDPWRELQQAEVVVTAGGQNSIADLAAATARAVVIPQDRPFDEQRATGRLLAASGLAVVADEWPAASEWPALLTAAVELQPSWGTWSVDGAARRAADVIHAEAVRWR